MQRNPQNSYKDTLKALGLTRDEAIIYQWLIINGTTKASVVATKLNMTRALVYRALSGLIKRDLVIKHDTKGAVTTFEPRHPSHLNQVINENQRQLRSAESGLQLALPDLTSLYNLAIGKPNMQFFEGQAGLKKVLQDSLTSTETIRSITDVGKVEAFAPKINHWYVHQRQKTKIKKKAIMANTAKAQKIMSSYHDQDLLQYKFAKINTLHANMNIYDNKISYITLDKKRLISVILEDPFIYNLHCQVFDLLWSMLR